MITPPPKRLRMKTPDPSRKHKSPDPRALKKAQKELKESKSSGSKDPTSRKLSFGKDTVHTIQAENPAPKKAPAKSSKGAAKMSREQAALILDRFVKAGQRVGSQTKSFFHFVHKQNDSNKSYIYIYMVNVELVN